MEKRVWIPSVIALIAGAVLAVWWEDARHRDPEPATNGTDASPGPGRKVASDPPWKASTVRGMTIPNEEALEASVDTAEPVIVGSTALSYVSKILVRTGDAVREGQTLVLLDTEDWEERLDDARKSGDAVAVREAEEALASMEIRAPQAGIVHEIRVRLGDRPPVDLQGGPRPMIVLFDWRALKFHVDAPGDLAGFLDVGTTVRIRYGGGRPMLGVIAGRGEALEDGRVPVTARPAQEPESVLDFEKGAEILVKTGERRALVVPASAVERGEGRDIVHTVTAGGTRVPVPVVLGPSVANGLVEIRSGLAPGQAIAVPKR